ncbi:hypothetical protein LWC34_07705 [Kibdelosporangium philippinense]|uniref:Uncharacterized protein n=1 Tax=Kibdelosporangium philippinense TaxID=211113 RepID=A0ABS8Z4F6_9PSEU|nr:hypothetical protein [Kibdelosporangium philippinense]MCE7002715.1 hypothetical protein [Kibdelosporangium philippinense]
MPVRISISLRGSLPISCHAWPHALCAPKPNCAGPPSVWIRSSMIPFSRRITK